MDQGRGPFVGFSPVTFQDIYGFTVTPDGRRLLWAQIDRNESDLVLLENFH